MAFWTGFQAILNYASGTNPRTGAALATDPNRVLALRDLLPNPDAGIGSDGAKVPGTGNSYLDEMSPGCAAQLYVELTALSAATT